MIRRFGDGVQNWTNSRFFSRCGSRKSPIWGKVVIPKGNRIIIGADQFAHHLRDGMIQPLGDATVQGYDTTGLAEYLLLVLKSRFPVSEMMEEYGIEDKEIQDEIECALDDIGF